MQQFILFIKGLVIGGLSLFSSPYQLEVNIENLERTKGTLYITLFNSEEDFKNDNFYRLKKLQVTKNMEPIRFETLPTGNYALKVFHDVNNNGQLDVSLFARNIIPTKITYSDSEDDDYNGEESLPLQVVFSAAYPFGDLDILIHAAGLNVPQRSLQELAPNDWDLLIQTNLTGSYNILNLALQRMRQQKRGLVILINLPFYHYKFKLI